MSYLSFQMNMKFTNEQIVQLIADMYYNAAMLLKDNFQRIVPLMEELRTMLQQEFLYTAWRKVTIGIELYDSPETIEFLKKLESSCFALLLSNTVMHLRRAFNENVEEGYRLFMQAYVTALIYKRSDVYLPLFNTSLPFTGVQNEELLKWNRLNKYIVGGRSIENYSILRELAVHPHLTTAQRCELELYAARVQLYFMPDFRHASRHIRRAMHLMTADNTHAVELAKVNYRIKMQAFERARLSLLKMLSKNPYDINVYLGLGNSYFEEGKLESAEKWYLDGRQVRAMDLDLVTRLINLYGSTSFFTEHREDIDQLVNKSEAVYGGREDLNWLYLVYCQAGDVYLFQKQYDTAIGYFEKARALKPFYSYAHTRMGALYTEKGDYEEAQRWLDDSLRVDANNYEALWEYGKLYSEMKEIDKAIDTFEICISLQPMMKGRIYTYIGSYYGAGKKFQTAAEWLEKALRVDPREREYYYNLLEVLDELQDLNSVETVLKQASVVWPRDAGIANDLAVNFFQQGKYNEALEAARRAVALDGSKDIFYRNLASIYRKMNNTAELLSILEKACSLNPDARNYNNLGVAYYNNGNYEAAIESYEKAIRLDAQDAIFYGNLASAYAKAGDESKAELAWMEAYERDAPDGTIPFYIGNFYAGLKRYDQALLYYEQAIMRHPDNTSYLLKKAEVLHKKGDLSAALEFCGHLLQKTQGLAPLYLLTGQLYLDIKGPADTVEKAISYLQQSISISPTAEAFLFLGMAWMKAAEYRNAEEAFIQAYEMDTANKDSRQMLASFYLHQQQPDKASQFLDFNKEELSV